MKATTAQRHHRREAKAARRRRRVRGRDQVLADARNAAKLERGERGFGVMLAAVLADSKPRQKALDKAARRAQRRRARQRKRGEWRH